MKAREDAEFCLEAHTIAIFGTKRHLRKTEQFYITKNSDIISKVTHFVNSFTLLF